jgi:SAM-dependent MidA family methyltransferase
MSELRSHIAGEIAEHGPLPFSRYVELALYTPELGFYEATGQAGGRRGDFVTSVETGPLFAAVIGDWLDGIWNAAGQPARFRVAEAAAGVGTLWRGIVKAAPACRETLEWLLVERSAALRSTHDTLPDGAVSMHDLPNSPVDVIIANELLDNLVFDIAIMTEHGWKPRLVDDVDGTLTLVTGEWPIGSPAADMATALPDDAPIGAELPIACGAAAWIERAQAIADRVLAFDYAANDAELLERGIDGWLRAYVGHERIRAPIDRPGICDITHDVPVDQLPPPNSVQSQAEWLHTNGIALRVEAARKTWQERAHIGDLEAMFARSAVTEADALTDPNGLGGFVVMEWVRDQG